MACFCEKEYDVLVISGNPPPEVLINAWEAIYLEFNDLMKDDTYSIITDIVQTIDLLNAKIKFAGSIIHHLQYEYRDDLMEMLSSLGIDITLNPDNETEYFKGLKKIVTRTKVWMLELQEAHVELAKMQDRQVNEGTNYDFFFDSLNAIGKHQGYGIKSADIYTAQFCKLFNRMKTANERKSYNNGD